MTHRDDLDQMLSTWLDDPYTPPAPAYLGQVLERTRQTRQRRAWANLERWLPMASQFSGPTAAWPVRMAWLLLIGLLVVALIAEPRRRACSPLRRSRHDPPGRRGRPGLRHLQ